MNSAWRHPWARNFGPCLDKRRSASGTVAMLAKGGGQFSRMQAFDGIRYLEGGVPCLIRGGREGYIFLRQVQDFMEPSMRILFVSRRTGPSTLMRDMIL